jgi:hypothetical protein
MTLFMMQTHKINWHGLHTALAPDTRSEIAGDKIQHDYEMMRNTATMNTNHRILLISAGL